MKRFISVLKCILALIVLCAAILVLSADIFYIKPNAPSYDPDTDTGSDDTQGDDNSGNNKPPVPDDPDVNIPDWSIRPTVIKNSLADKNGKVLCEMRYLYPSVSANDGSDISSFAQALEKISSEIRLYVDLRSEIYKSETSVDFSVPPQITGYYTVNRFSSELFSISFIFSEISPNGSITETRLHYNLDLLLSSSEITIDAIMNDAVGSVEDILSKKDENGALALYPNYEKLLAGMIDGVWTVSPNGLAFYFPSGTIAPASSGDVEVFIEKSELSSLLSQYGKILLNVAS